MGQVRTLVRYRFRRGLHRLLAEGAPIRIVAGVVGAVVLVVAGWALSPSDFGPQEAGGGVTHWGGWAIETGFYLGCLVAAIQSFRILEAFFRHADARVLATLPIRLPALFRYRLLAILLDTAVLTAGCGLFLLPVWLKGSPDRFAGAIALLVAAAVLTVAVGFAAQMAAGVADYKHVPSFISDLEERSGAAQGGAAAYLYSPAIALGVTLLLLLFAKLATDEVFRAQHQGAGAFPGIARFTAVAVIGIAVSCFIWARRNFVRQYPLLFARFFEADLFALDVGYDYFARDRRPSRGLEAMLDPEVRTLYRLDRLQMARRAPLTRLLNVAFPVVMAVLFLGLAQRLEPWMVLGLGLAWLLVFSNPWSRLFHPMMDPGMGAVLPVDEDTRRRARSALLRREVLVLSLPFAACGLVFLVRLDGNRTLQMVSATVVVVVIGLALVEPLRRLAGRWHRAPRAVGLLIATAFAALTQLGAAGPWLGMLALVGLELARGQVRHPDPADHLGRPGGSRTTATKGVSHQRGTTASEESEP